MRISKVQEKKRVAWAKHVAKLDKLSEPRSTAEKALVAFMRSIMQLPEGWEPYVYFWPNRAKYGVRVSEIGSRHANGGACYMHCEGLFNGDTARVILAAEYYVLVYDDPEERENTAEYALRELLGPKAKSKPVRSAR